MEKLRVEFTKSRPRHSNDNALAEGKNAAIVRKLYGHAHIPKHWANNINALNQQEVYRYINFRFFGISRGHAQDVVFSIDRSPVLSCKSI